MLGTVLIVGLSEDELRFHRQLPAKRTWLRIKGGSSVFGAVPFPDQMLDALGGKGGILKIRMLTILLSYCSEN